MAKPVPAFISFDYDNDDDLRAAFVAQASNPDTPFSIVDHSVKEPLPGNWKEKVRTRIKRAEQMIVLCGESTHTAAGVSTEVEIAQEEGTPYFLLHCRKDRECTKPRTAKSSDKIYKWTWPNVAALLNGSR